MVSDTKTTKKGDTRNDEEIKRLFRRGESFKNIAEKLDITPGLVASRIVTMRHKGESIKRWWED